MGVQPIVAFTLLITNACLVVMVLYRMRTSRTRHEGMRDRPKQRGQSQSSWEERHPRCSRYWETLKLHHSLLRALFSPQVRPCRHATVPAPCRHATVLLQGDSHSCSPVKMPCLTSGLTDLLASCCSPSSVHTSACASDHTSVHISRTTGRGHEPARQRGSACCGYQPEGHLFLDALLQRLQRGGVVCRHVRLHVRER